MARYTGPACRLCRRDGVKLFLKGERCHTSKCAVDKRKTIPGQHGTRKSKLSDYGLQLREKQKLRRIYGLLERQFSFVLNKCLSKRGKTGDLLIQSLETRLDSVVLNIGLARSRKEARQLVRHGHLLVNNRKANIPSMQLKVGDKVSVLDKSRDNSSVLASLELLKSVKSAIPSWLRWDSNSMLLEVLSLPQRADVSIPVNEQLIVELYSK